MVSLPAGLNISLVVDAAANAVTEERVAAKVFDMVWSRIIHQWLLLVAVDPSLPAWKMITDLLYRTTYLD